MNISTLKVSEIKNLSTRSMSKELLLSLAEDQRVGVQEIYRRLLKKKEDSNAERRRLNAMFHYEREVRSEGFKLPAGTDACGIGSLAASVYAAAVILPERVYLEGLNDSKKLSAKQRERLTELIKEKAVAWAIGVATQQEISLLNVHWASLLASKRAVERLNIKPDIVLVDGLFKIPQLGLPQLPITAADKLSVSVAAASIIAKTARDHMMKDLHKKYPMYGFNVNNGYPTAAHLAALKKYGPCPVHRSGYKPVLNAQTEQNNVQLKLF